MYVDSHPRKIEENLHSLVRTRSKTKKWLQFLRKKRISFFQGVPKTMVLTNYQDEDDL
jgi:hypothetical protein